jgi:hypothetical protein
MAVAGLTQGDLLSRSPTHLQPHLPPHVQTQLRARMLPGRSPNNRRKWRLSHLTTHLLSFRLYLLLLSSSISEVR